MEPQVRYAKAADGVSIAYWTYGAGPPLLLSPHGMICHIVEQFRIPQMRRWFDLLAGRYTVIQYDYRGFGSSQRQVGAISPETMLLDIEAVAAASGIDRFALFGSMINGAIACAYAARYPHRVSHLILWTAGWGGPRTGRARGQDALNDMATKDWNLFARLHMQAMWGWADPEQARAYTRLFRESTDAETWLATLEAWKTIDIKDVLANLNVPTLVVGSDSPSVPNPEGSRQLAAGIPGARLVTARSPDYVPWLGEDGAIEAIGIVAEFLEGVPADEARPSREAPKGTAAASTAIILFADIADSTALTERLGDSAFREKARPLDEALRNAVRDHGGTVVDGKTLGDGILATFSAASQAIAAAVEVEATASRTGFGLHIGLHAGDVLREIDADGRSNVFGSAVSIASRISALAPPGEILVSRTVADLARSSAGVTFEDRGEHALKGIAEPQRVFAVRKDGGA